mgnify:CR=1 FL=1
MKVVLAKALAVVLTMLASSSCFSAPQWCYGTITAAWVHSSGELFVLPSWRGDHIRVCSVTSAISVNGATVDPTVCLSWLSTVRLAMAGGKSTVMHYPDAVSCAQLPIYTGAPLPTYIMVQSI